MGRVWSKNPSTSSTPSSQPKRAKWRRTSSAGTERNSTWLRSRSSSSGNPPGSGAGRPWNESATHDKPVVGAERVESRAGEDRGATPPRAGLDHVALDPVGDDRLDARLEIVEPLQADHRQAAERPVRASHPERQLVLLELAALDLAVAPARVAGPADRERARPGEVAEAQLQQVEVGAAHRLVAGPRPSGADRAVGPPPQVHGLDLLLGREPLAGLLAVRRGGIPRFRSLVGGPDPLRRCLRAWASRSSHHCRAPALAKPDRVLVELHVGLVLVGDPAAERGRSVPGRLRGSTFIRSTGPRRQPKRRSSSDTSSSNRSWVPTTSRLSRFRLASSSLSASTSSDRMYEPSSSLAVRAKSLAWWSRIKAGNRNGSS